MSCLSRLRAAVSRAADPFLGRLARNLSLRQKALEESGHRNAPPGVILGEGSLIYPAARIFNLSGAGHSIHIGRSCQVRGELITYWNGGAIEIGDQCFIGPGSRIWSQTRIRIGSYVLVSHGVDIHDSDGHPISPLERRADIEAIFAGGYRTPTETLSAPVTIEDDAWICLKSTILKGVTIGRGAIVAAGSVVTKDVPAMTLVAGNPAQVIRELSDLERAR